MSLEMIVLDERLKMLNAERCAVIKRISKGYKHLRSLYYRVDARTLEKGVDDLQSALDEYARITEDRVLILNEINLRK